MSKLNKHRLDKLIPMAIEVIKDREISIPNENGKVNNTFHGYMASFGADMVLTSPLAAAIFFEDKSGAKESRDLVPKAILKLLSKEKPNEVKPQREEKLSAYLIRHAQDGKLPKALIDDLVAAAVALKMALRTFPLES
jgi:hypothetical protein